MGRRRGSTATPATAAAARAGIAHQVHAYEHAAGRRFGEEAAAALGVDAARVHKTLVVRLSDGRHSIAVVPVAASLDLKAMAAALDAKQATMADPGEAERLTGYVVGGISPLGQKRRLPTVLDASAMAHPTVFVSAGRRGLELELAPGDLARLTDATIAVIAHL
jgi:Cys-tRNA(Pro)/Cys-tRNA(Cys) deacylase